MALLKALHFKMSSKSYTHTFDCLNDSQERDFSTIK